MGIYSSVTGVIAIGATLMYSHGIILNKEEKDAAIMANFCLLITLAISFLTLLIVLFFGGWLVQLFHAPAVRAWLFFAPITILTTGITEIYSIYVNRLKKYKYLTFSRVGSSLVQITISIIIGLIFRTAFGLLVAMLVAQLFGALFLIVITHRLSGYPFFVFYSKAEYRDNAFRFKNFPLYSLPADVINNFCNQLPVFMMGAFSPNAFTNIGAYNMSVRLLGLPTQLLSSSIAEVFRQRASEDYNTTGSCKPIFIKTLRFLFYFSIIPFSLIAVFSPELFGFFLGAKWKLSGELTQVLSFMYFMRFIISPLSYVVNVAQKQYVSLLLDIYLVTASYLIFYVCFNVYHLTIYWTIFIYAMNYGIMYLLTLYISYKSTINYKRHALTA